MYKRQGIGCKRWITINGFSINIDCELENFNKIVPCGIENCLMGRGSNYNNLLFPLNDAKHDVFKIDRGGEVTCHMPGQLVTYLVLDLKNFKKDLNWYLRKIEETIIKILGTFNIECHSREGFTGVWVGNKKIASIGIGCKRWITINGFSINIDCELENFNKIVPVSYTHLTLPTSVIV